MKKALSTAVLVVSLFGNSNVYAAAVVLDPTNLVQNTTSAIKSALTAASSAVIEAKTTAMEAWDKSVWVKQAKDMIDSIQAAIDAKNELTSEITGARAAATGFISTKLAPADPKDAIDYKYAPKLPETYIPTITCSSTGTGCTVTGTGYTGVATVATNSANLRNALRVDPATIGLGNEISRVSGEAAEKNAQEVAIIHAMAREAYVQANNQIVKIGELQAALSAPPAGKANDLKYAADMQAVIQAHQALLVNEQNKIAALAVLQQSQRDMYEQRKREIAAYVIQADRTSNATQVLARAAITTGTAAAYAAVAAIY